MTFHTSASFVIDLASSVFVITENTPKVVLIVDYVATFADVDECTNGNGMCEMECSNTPGSYHCNCWPGYQLSLNMRDCVGKFSDVCMNLECKF